MPTAGQILRAFESQIKQDITKLKDQLAEFGSKLQHPKNHHEPAHEYEFGDGYTVSAAYLRVLGTVLQTIQQMPTARDPVNPLTTDERLEKLIAICERQLLHKARFPSNSTSIGANTIHMYETACWAELLECLRDPWSIRGVW